MDPYRERAERPEYPSEPRPREAGRSWRDVAIYVLVVLAVNSMLGGVLYGLLWSALHPN